MTDEQKEELTRMRERLTELRNDALMPRTFDARVAVSLSHAIRALHFVLTGEEWKEAS